MKSYIQLRETGSPGIKALDDINSANKVSTLEVSKLRYNMIEAEGKALFDDLDLTDSGTANTLKNILDNFMGSINMCTSAGSSPSTVNFITGPLPAYTPNNSVSYKFTIEDPICKDI